MHCRRADDRLAQSCPGPSNEVLPGKQKSIAIDPMLKLARYICPNIIISFQIPVPCFFGKELWTSFLQGSLVQWDQKFVPSSDLRRVILGVPTVSGKANEQLLINIDEFLSFFLLFSAQFSWLENSGWSLVWELNNFGQNPWCFSSRNLFGAQLKCVHALFGF